MDTRSAVFTSPVRRRYRRACSPGQLFGIALLGVGLCLSAGELSPAVHFRFNALDGVSLHDEAGSVGATLHGGHLVSSPRGLAVSLNGEGDRVDYGFAPALRMDGSFSVALWVRVDPERDAGTTRLIFGDIANRSVGRNLSIKLDKYQRIHFEWGNGEAYNQVTAPAGLLGGGWRHLACVCDAENRRSLLYVDGGEVGRGAVEFDASRGVGTRFQSGAWWQGNAFRGEIDDLRIFRRALRSEEVQMLAAEPAEGPMPMPSRPEPAPPVGQAGPLNREQLVAWYTFEEGEGDVLKDHSGHGHDGRIEGASWVTGSPWGGALHFDGRDDVVNLGRPKGLNLSGDLTLEVWLRTSLADAVNRQPLIVGMNENWAKERNYNLRIDNRNRLRFEWGDGTDYSAVTHPAAFVDGGWRYIAVVVDSGQRCHLYADGRLIHTGDAGMPITARPLEDVMIGGWSHGFLRGDIAELRIFNRALGPKEIWRHAGFADEDFRPTLRVTAAYDIRSGEVICDVSVGAGGERSLSLALGLVDTESGRQLASKIERLAPTGEPVSHLSRRVRFRVDIPAGGIFRVDAALLAQDDAVLVRTQAPLPYEGRPDWVDAGVGVTEAVLPPYSPCTIDRIGEGIAVGTWGRRHVFGDGPLLAAVESAGAGLLAGPVRTPATVDGRRVHWHWASPTLVEATPAHVSVRQEATAGVLRLTLDTTVEYDGLMRTEVVLASSSPVAVGRFAIEAPMLKAQATLLYAWRGTVLHSGALTEGFSAAFTPILWVGNERRGLCWVAESDQFWSPAGFEKAMEVQPLETTTVLRLNLVSEPLTLIPGEPLTYRFGLQATPVRPMDRTYWDLRVHRQPPYGNEFSWPEKTIGGRPALDYYAENGARALIVWRWWNVFSYMLPVGHEEPFRKLVDAVHSAGLQLLPYTIGFLISEKAPEFAGWRQEFLRTPVSEFPIVTNRLPGLAGQTCYQTCPHGYWTDFAVAMAARCMDEYGVDGVYLDTTVRPMPCNNETHGCGYVRADGSRAPTYPVFGVRELIKRLRAAVRARKADGLVDVHPYDCVNVPALAFADGMWIGEHLRSVPHKPDALPLDRFRAEFMGHNLGIPADLLYYKLRDYDASVAIALLHDVPVRSEKDADFDIIAGIYRTREAFDCAGARFIGYWETGDLVDVEPADCYASLWQHPENGVLAVVSNLSRQDERVTVRLDSAALGLLPGLTAEDTRTHVAVPILDGVFARDVPSQQWTLVWIRPGR